MYFAYNDDYNVFFLLYFLSSKNCTNIFVYLVLENQ